MLNNYDMWGLTCVDSTGILSILHIPTDVSNGAGSNVIRGFSGTSLGTKFEVEISTDSLLGTATMEDPVQIDPPNCVIPAPNINN